MPICLLRTSLPRTGIPKAFEKHLSHKIAELLGKPIEKMSVIVHSDLAFCRAGSYDPAAFLEIRAIDVITASTTPKYTRVMVDYLSHNLSLPKERVYLQYVPLDKTHIGSGAP
ncbi:Hypothetical predicted protein [Octopus vulgaris]|uniref:D-dopachrome decarboxylase n=1 Tax=Octopus vulgaris TaxID=6645 RepID=A0AA36BV91_OCTVU|nr:Hypothetical predicted protein [Octopus vulgaris]